jgi:hypothetical protein
VTSITVPFPDHDWMEKSPLMREARFVVPQGGTANKKDGQKDQSPNDTKHNAAFYDNGELGSGRDA